jgi:hypothetical protein
MQQWPNQSPNQRVGQISNHNSQRLNVMLPKLMFDIGNADVCFSIWQLDYTISS